MVEEGLNEIRPPALEIEVVGVLPYVAGEERRLTLGQRVDRVRRRDDLQLTAFGDEPAPAAAELADCRRLELLLELVETAAVAVDGLSDRPARRAAAVRLHRIPEKGMVPHLRGVVKDARLGRVLVGGLDYLLERLLLRRGALDEVVEVRDIGLMMPAVMKIHRPLGDMRLQRVFRVRQGRQFESH